MVMIDLNGQMHALMTTICRFDISLGGTGRTADGTAPVIHPRPKGVFRKLISFE